MPSTALLLLFACLQSGSDGAPADPAAAGTNGKEAAPWQRLNHLALVVNERGITSFEIQRQLLRIAAQEGVARNDREGMRRLQATTIGVKAREMLEEQAGHDLGFEPDQVRRIVADQLEREEERAGSIARLAEYLAEQEKDSGTRRNEVQAYVYRRLYEDAATGKGPGPLGRPTVDAYVRPGRLWFEHVESLRGLADERKVRITQLIVSVRREGGPEAARDLAGELRQRILGGADMGDLCEEFGATPPGTRGASDLLPMGGLRRIYPDVHDFLAGASLGDLSGVLPYEDRDGVLVGYLVVRLDEWQEVDPPAFDGRDYQRTLRRRLEETVERQRLGESLENLARAAYVWPPGALGGGAPAPTGQGGTNDAVDAPPPSSGDTEPPAEELPEAGAAETPAEPGATPETVPLASGAVPERP